MDNNNLSPEESFTIINKAISNFKINYKENAKSFLIFGWIFTLASLSNFIILRILHSQEAYQLMGPYSLGNWLVFGIIGFIFLYFMIRKEKRVKRVYSHLDGYNKKLWGVTAISFVIGTIICIKLNIAPPPVMLLIAGIATTTTGLLIKFRPLTIGGLAFFAFSIAATFITNEYLALLVCGAIICGYLIPGYLLKSAKE